MYSNSGKKRKSRPPTKAGPRAGSRKSGRKNRRASAKPTSSFASPTPSRATITLRVGKVEAPQFAYFSFGLLATLLLVVLGNSQWWGYALTLFCSGLFLVINPPKLSLGRGFDWGFLALLLAGLTSFIPLFYWKKPEWRVAAEALGADLPTILSVQPMISFEAFVLLLSGIGFLYAAVNWSLNHTGRLWVYAGISVFFASLAGYTIYGDFNGWQLASDERNFSYFPERELTLFLVALGGVLTFGFGIDGLTAKKPINMVGLLVSCLCVAALVVAASLSGFAYFILGLSLLYLFRLKRGKASRRFKWLAPACLFLVLFLLFRYGPINEKYHDLRSFSLDRIVGAEQVGVSKDAVSAILESPLTGLGLGNFSAVFPQYRSASASTEAIKYPQSDWLWLGVEGGILTLSIAFFLVSLFLWKCLKAVPGHSEAYRHNALTGVVLMLLAALFTNPFHRPGLAFLFIILVALALPRNFGQRSVCRPKLWRFFGGSLILLSFVWATSGIWNNAFYSKTAIDLYEQRLERALEEIDYADGERAVGKLIAIRPLYWENYAMRAELNLAQLAKLGLEEASADFARARFFEPHLADVTYREGKAWLAYDVTGAAEAWQNSLLRFADDKDSLFAAMVEEAQKNYRLMREFAKVSSFDPHFRTLFLKSLEGDALMRELGRDLNEDPGLSKFTTEQRTDILQTWITKGDLTSANAFLEANKGRLNDVWQLDALILKTLAQFQQALDIVIEHADIPDLPAFPENFNPEKNFAQLERSFAVGSEDLKRYQLLLRIFMEKEDFENALRVTEALLKMKEVPDYAPLLRAKLLYLLGDYIESWYSFEQLYRFND